MTENTIKLIKAYRQRGELALCVATLLRKRLERAFTRVKSNEPVIMTVKPVCAGLLPATTSR